MKQSRSYYAASNLVEVCVDRIFDGDYSGRLWNLYDVRPQYFFSSVEMCRMIDDFCDSMDFPQRSTSLRSFRSSAEGTGKHSGQRNMERKPVNDMENNRGNEGTFIVQVKYRQNATWQGEVTWVEQNKKVHFRSALELLKLMSGALEEKDRKEETE